MLTHFNTFSCANMIAGKLVDPQSSSGRDMCLAYFIAMKYIIMCGGTYRRWETPRQLTQIQGEPVVARTIRLLRECGVTDIAISSHNAMFERFGVPVLHHENHFDVFGSDNCSGVWVNGFWPTEDPVCYILGDVVFTKAAIRTIVDTQTDDIMFFASAPPFAPEYRKPHAEPFAFKVVDQKRFRKAIEDVKRYDAQGLFNRRPIAWELWQVITGGQLNVIDFTNYVAINDSTCDIDSPDDVRLFQ